MFISSYTTVYFFVKKFRFLNVYMPVNTIFECLCMFFWLRKGLSIKYVGNWQLVEDGIGGGGSSKIRTEGGVSRLMCKYVPTFNGYFSPTTSTSVVMK